MDRFLQMVVNTVMRRMVNLMVDKGFSHFSTKGKSTAEPSEADRSQGKSAKALSNRARDIAKLARKIR